MTLKDADKIKEAIKNSDDFVGGSDDIIKVIDSVPEVVISTDTDTISRKAAIKEVSRDIPVKSWKDVARVVELMKIFADRIKQLPPVQPLNQDSIEAQSSDPSQIAAQIIHNAIDNTTFDEDAYPGIKEQLHRSVEEWKKLQPVFTEIAEEYKKSCEISYINKPLAHALYEVWKKHNRRDTNRNE